MRGKKNLKMIVTKICGSKDQENIEGIASVGSVENKERKLIIFQTFELDMQETSVCRCFNRELCFRTEILRKVQGLVHNDRNRGVEDIEGKRMHDWIWGPASKKHGEEKKIEASDEKPDRVHQEKVVSQEPGKETKGVESCTSVSWGLMKPFW